MDPNQKGWTWPVIDLKPTMGRGPRNWLIALGVVVLLVILGSIGKNIYTEWLWFDNLGFSSVYKTILLTKVWLFFAAALVFFALLWGNIALARRLSPKIELPIPIPGQIAKIGLVMASVFLSTIFGAIASGNWEAILRFFNAQPFGTFDPIFGRDVAFYIFALPVYRFLQGWLVGAVVMTLIAIAAIYGINFAVRGAKFTFTPAIKGHILGLGATIFLLISWHYRLNILELVSSPGGLIYGAAYADVGARLPALWILIGVAAICAVLLVVNVFRRGFRLSFVSIGVWIAATIVVGSIYPALIQRLQVDPNELAMETPYLEHNITMTREAFGLGEIEESLFPAEETFSHEDIENNPDIINNIRLWDHRPLKDTYNQIQFIRLYYDFLDVDVDRYTIDGQYQQVMLGARELSPEKLPSEAQRWVNQRLQYTHGYGLAMSPVTDFTAEGQPELLIRDVPPTGVIEVDRPEIYYGEKTTGYVIVNSNTPEFDYPTEEDIPVYTRYQGEGGVPLSSFIRKLCYAWQFGEINILISGELTPGSRIQYYRNIQARVRHVAPFLRLDGDPYLVVDDGRLVWIQDAYTTADNYPYSQPFQQGFNYIRNSVKVVISAYDGSMKFYVFDPDDAVINTYEAIFPTLFSPMEEMPQSLREHMRYPEDLFMVQAEMYLTYHMDDPRVFYNKEELWSLPNELYYGSQQPMEAYYVIMRLPGEERPEFLLMLPFTPANKPNLTAWMAARSDGEEYGKLLAYNFPKGEQIDGPTQVEARIDNDPTISEQLTLWGQRGSMVIRGNLLVIPIEDSLLYIEPIYLQAEALAFPELKRVIVASGDSLAMEESLEAALAAVLGEAPPTPPEDGLAPTDIASLVQSAEEHYARAQEYLQAGDWAGYGAELEALESDLRRLAELTAEEE